MAHINLENNLPGVTGLLEYRKDTSVPLRELTQILLRGKSTLSESDRELIAGSHELGQDFEHVSITIFSRFSVS